MSHAVITVATMTTGGLIIGGLIIGGLIIGKAVIYAADKIQEGKDKISAETLAANKEDLLGEFNKSLEMVLEDIQTLDPDYKGDILSEAEKLKSLPVELLNKYTIEIYNSDGHEQFLNTAITAFNHKIMEFKQKIEVKKLEINETKNFLEQKLNILEKQLNQSLQVPDIYLEEYQALKENFAGITKKDSVEEKVSLLDYFEHQLTAFSRTCRLNQEIKLENMTEEKIKTSEVVPEAEKIKKEIFHFHEKIKFLDNSISAELEPLVVETAEAAFGQRLELIRDQVKLKYGKLKEQVAQSNLFKQNLAKLSFILLEYSGSEDLLKQINVLLQNQYISKVNFEEISRRLNDFIAHAQTAEVLKLQKKELTGKVRSSLENLGYNIVGQEQEPNEMFNKLDKGEIVYIDTEWPGYKVMLKIDELHHISTRLARFVASEAEKESVSTYQKQKDKEISKKWCADYDRFLAEMKKGGVHLATKLRKEAEDEDILCLVNKAFSNNINKEQAQITNNNQRSL